MHDVRVEVAARVEPRDDVVGRVLLVHPASHKLLHVATTRAARVRLLRCVPHRTVRLENAIHTHAQASQTDNERSKWEKKGIKKKKKSSGSPLAFTLN